MGLLHCTIAVSRAHLTIKIRPYSLEFSDSPCTNL